MKKMILVSFITLFFGLSLKAQQNNIVVSIAKKSTPCNSTDLGYQIYYGPSSSSELERKAVTDVKRNNPDWENVESRDNIDWGKYMGNYVVIVTSSVTDSKGCNRNTYGVGFGTNSDEALDDAINNLSTRNWSWNEKKHGFKIDFERRY